MLNEEIQAKVKYTMEYCSCDDNHYEFFEYSKNYFEQIYNQKLNDLWTFKDIEFNAGFSHLPIIELEFRMRSTDQGRRYFNFMLIRTHTAYSISIEKESVISEQDVLSLLTAFIRTKNLEKYNTNNTYKYNTSIDRIGF